MKIIIYNKIKIFYKNGKDVEMARKGQKQEGMLSDVGIWCNTLVCVSHTVIVAPHNILSCFCSFCAIPTYILTILVENFYS